MVKHAHLALDCRAAVATARTSRPGMESRSAGARNGKQEPASLADSPSRVQYKMRGNTNGWKQLGERYKRANLKPSSHHHSILDSWDLSKLLGSAESPTSSEFLLKNFRAPPLTLTSLLGQPIGFEGGGDDHAKERLQLCSKTAALPLERCYLCGATSPRSDKRGKPCQLCDTMERPVLAKMLPGPDRRGRR